MQRLASIVVVAAALAASVAWARAADDPPGVARVGLVEGQASYRLRGSDEWTGVAVNAPLVSGDQFFAAAGSRAEIQLAPATYARLDTETQLDLVELAGDATQVAVPLGRMILRLREDPTDRHVEIDTPGVALVLGRAGSYRVDVESGGRTTVRVGRGEAVAYVGDQNFEIYAESSAVIDSAPGEGAFRPVAYAEDDDFDRWEQARDARVDASTSYQHVSTDIYGAEDLDDNGVWEYRAGYGALWRPTSLSAGWAPYRDGRWVWVEPWGWTWLDDAAWGWAPFHYGRWVWLDGYWYWGPGAVVARPAYAPALVAFYGPGLGGVSISVGFGAGYIGWVPLGWGEPCYPWWSGFAGARVGYPWWGGWGGPRVYHHGRHGGHGYANRHHPGGFTAVRRGDFARGGRVIPAGGRDRHSWRAIDGRVGISPERSARRAVDPSRLAVGRTGRPPATSTRRDMARARRGEGRGGGVRTARGVAVDDVPRGGRPVHRETASRRSPQASGATRTSVASRSPTHATARTSVTSRPSVHVTTTRAPSAPRQFARRSEPYVAQRPTFHPGTSRTGVSVGRTGGSPDRSEHTGARRTVVTGGSAPGVRAPAERVTVPSRVGASRGSYRRSNGVERSSRSDAPRSPSRSQASPPASRRTTVSSGASASASSRVGSRSWSGRVFSQPQQRAAPSAPRSTRRTEGSAGSAFGGSHRVTRSGSASAFRGSPTGGFGGGGRTSGSGGGHGGGRLGVGRR